MPDDAARVAKLLRQQAAIAGFGSFALHQGDLTTILTEAAQVCAEGLGVPFCKVCRYRPAESDLLIEAGYGWHDGVVGHVVSRADTSSPQGRTFITGQTAICDDLRKDNYFTLPPFYTAHGIISTIDVVIKSDDTPYGVLEIDNDHQHDYDRHDVDFLIGFANVLAAAVATSARMASLRSTVEQMKRLVQDKDRILDQKKMPAEELQHRVRNNLQLVYGMLSKQLDDTVDKAGQRGLRSIARRVSTLAQVYDHLLGAEMTRTTDFGGYVQSLCRGLAEVQAPTGKDVRLTCATDPLGLDLDSVTALGIVVAELVSNSYEHAFPGDGGTIAVCVRAPDGNLGMASLTVTDDGTGFHATAESKRHGVGLARRLVQQIRGTVTLQSNQGTAWTITFPVS